jgi:hypothetical protein
MRRRGDLLIGTEGVVRSELCEGGNRCQAQEKCAAKHAKLKSASAHSTAISLGKTGKTYSAVHVSIKMMRA